MTQTTVSVCRNGVWQKIGAEDLVVGDIVCVEAGERVPADIRLTNTEDLFVSQSVITGESGSFEKNAKAVTGNPKKISDYTNILFQGTTVTGGAGVGVVQTVGANTVYGGLSVDRTERCKFDRGSSSIAHVLIKFMAILAPIVFIAGGITKGSWLEAFLFALSVAVGLTPEMLPMVINACLAKGSFQMSREQTVVKNINAMQALGETDVLCTDKTGTLTDDTVTLEYYMDVLGNESQRVLDCAVLNSSYRSGVANPLDEAILKCRDMPSLQNHFKELLRESTLLDELPFDYEHKYAGILLGGAELINMQLQYTAMFQAGWFVESMWSQTLVIHMIRTPKLPFIKSRASAPVTILTMTGIAVVTAIPFTPVGTLLGFSALPVSYFAYLIPCFLLYMLLATLLKKAYVRRYGELL